MKGKKKEAVKEDIIVLSIAKEFSDTPGARYRSDGPRSGEEFRDTLLVPKFNETREKKVKLLVDLDGGYGYATSFLEEAFGGLVRLMGSEIVKETINFKSDDEPNLISEIYKYIELAGKDN